jgi:TonB family protein
MPRPSYPAIMRRAGVEGRVVLRALVNPCGSVDSSSILALQATHEDFVPPARRALAAAAFRPARFGGRMGAAWITMGIDVTLTRE